MIVRSCMSTYLFLRRGWHSSFSAAAFSTAVIRPFPSFLFRREKRLNKGAIDSNSSQSFSVPFDSPSWLQPEEVFQNCLQFIQLHIVQSIASNQILSKSNGLQVEVRPSTIPNSGSGVFAKESLKTGEIISFYPGVYYPPLPSWLVSLPDGSTPVDLRPMNSSLDNQSIDVYKINSSFGGFLDAKFSQTSNIGLAHLINHPPKGTHPNVFSYSFYWDEFVQWLGGQEEKGRITLAYRVKSEIIPLLNEIPSGEPWYLDPNSEEVMKLSKDCSPLVGIAFIANREIEKGEEIFYDYKFKPSSDLPSWYYPIT